MGDKNNTAASEKNKVGFWAVVVSIIAAAFGVQSDKNRERDFSKGNLWIFIAGGLIFTVLFVLGIVLAVKLALSQVS